MSIKGQIFSRDYAMNENMIKGPKLSLWEMARPWVDRQRMNLFKILGEKKSSSKRKQDSAF